MSIVSIYSVNSYKRKREGHALFNMVAIPGSGSTPTKPVPDYKVWQKKMPPTGLSELKITV